MIETSDYLIMNSSFFHRCRCFTSSLSLASPYPSRAFYIRLSRLKFMGSDLTCESWKCCLESSERHEDRKEFHPINLHPIHATALQRWIKKCSISHYTHIIFRKHKRYAEAKKISGFYFSYNVKIRSSYPSECNEILKRREHLNNSPSKA